MLITRGEPGQVYNIGSGESHSIQELLEILLEASHVAITVQQDPKRMRPAEVPEVRCDVTRLQEQTGWRPAIPFEQSLHDVLEYWRDETKKRT
jgi:GDP-4-dehydro-6-deoxy-D-mannose reductase